MDTQYMIILKVSNTVDLQAFITMYHSSSGVFEKHTQWHENVLHKYRTRKLPGGQNIFLF